MNKNLVISVVIILVFGLGMYFLTKNAKVPSTQNSSPVLTQENNSEGLNNLGLYMNTLKEGSGDAVSSDGNLLSVRYAGYFEDGTVFDTNIDSSELFSFTLGAGEVIPGWDIGLKDMKVGEIRRLVVPPQYGYGEFEVGPIPPNSTLVFDVELVEIK